MGVIYTKAYYCHSVDLFIIKKESFHSDRLSFTQHGLTCCYVSTFACIATEYDGQITELFICYFFLSFFTFGLKDIIL